VPRRAEAQSGEHRVYVISDGTGATAERALRAALTQFGSVEVHVERWADVRTKTQVRNIVEEAADVGAFIVHTVVSKKLRKHIVEQGRLMEVETIDLMGPLLAKLAVQFASSPAETPGLFRELNQAYFRRIEAMEFALRHDDGKHTEELSEADIVLLGVSRTFKTPLSIYLSQRGWLVGNVPIIMDMLLPQAVLDLDTKKVFGLATTPYRLATLRLVRQQHLGGAGGDYADPEAVRREVLYSRQLYAENPQWRVIEVTDKPIEEIASELLEGMRRKRPPG
jgi:regulator of PEP synthase PpsR (kinase-PPPase family)